MLTSLLHRVAANPWVYDRIQTLAGNRHVLERLKRELLPLNPKVVVDVGGGTGSMGNFLSGDCKYICVDLEMAKLQGFRRKVRSGLAILGDATLLPIGQGCADAVLCKSVTHHLTDSQLDKVLDEAQRVLRWGGHMLLFDAVLNRKLIAGRLIWKFDRGSYPRASEDLEKRFSDRFRIAHWEKFAIYHEYVFGIGVRR